MPKGPVSAHPFADDGHVQTSERRSIAEMIERADDLGRERIAGLLKGLSKTNASKRENTLNNFIGGTMESMPPFLGENKGQSEHVISDGSQQTADQPYPDCAPKQRFNRA